MKPFLLSLIAASSFAPSVQAQVPAPSVEETLAAGHRAFLNKVQVRYRTHPNWRTVLKASQNADFELHFLKAQLAADRTSNIPAYFSYVAKDEKAVADALAKQESTAAVYETNSNLPNRPLQLNGWMWTTNLHPKTRTSKRSYRTW
jgi:hypothetical protein